MINKTLLFAALITLVSLRRVTLGLPWQKDSNQVISNDPLPYQVLYYTQKVSHFDFRQTGQVWKQKYLINLTHWSKPQKGPILMYCGNEGPIEMFYKNTGWYNDYVTSELKGMLVYPEHRYFGQSWPFGDQKTSMLKQNLGYLTTQQAMMDFVQFIQFLKKTYCSDCPVIVFGGSYGGMLATWMRMKYPNVVDMAHAASAPIYYYRNRRNFDLGIFYQLVTSNYQRHNSNCPNVIREGFRRLLAYYASPKAPIADLSKWFNLCTPLKVYSDIANLIDYVNVGYSYMAMLNYPYPTSFLKNLTSWPANSSCIPLDSVTQSSTDEQLFSALKKSVEYYYSFNKTQCNQIYEDGSSDEDMSGWNVLACADQAMPMTMDGEKDMFYKVGFDYEDYTSQCFKDYGVKPDYDYTLNHFGGIVDQQYLSASRIVFTNGGLDPWSGASPKTNLSDSLPSCFIPNGAHHLDLRPPNVQDPEDVVKCRKFVLDTLKSWIATTIQEKVSKNIRTQ